VDGHLIGDSFPTAYSEIPVIKKLLEDSPMLVEIPFEIDKIPYSTLEVGHSVFDVRVLKYLIGNGKYVGRHLKTDTKIHRTLF
jgi:hypothetical protein